MKAGKVRSLITAKRGPTSKSYRIDQDEIMDKITESSDLLYLSTLIRSSSGSTSESEMLPLIIGSEAYSKLVGFFGGSRIRIPSLSDILDSTQGVMMYYYYDILGYSWNESLNRLQVPLTRGNKQVITNRYNEVKSSLDDELREATIPDLMVKESVSSEEDTSGLRMVRCMSGHYVPSDIYTSVSRTVLETLLRGGYVSQEDYDDLKCRGFEDILNPEKEITDES